VDLSPLHSRLESIDKGQERTERTLTGEIARNREEGSNQARGLREEMSGNLKSFNDSVLKQMSDIANLQKNQLEVFAAHLAAISQSSEKKLDAMRGALDSQLKTLLDDSGKRLEQMRQEASANARQTRDETALALKAFNESVLNSMEVLKGTVEG